MQLLTYADPKNKDQTGTANIKGMNTSSTITQDRLFNNFQGDFGLVATELMNDNRSISEYESIRDALLAKSEGIQIKPAFPKAQVDPGAQRANVLFVILQLTIV